MLTALACALALASDAVEVAYGPEPHARMDVYPAKDPARGTVVFVHGGSWVGGSRDNLARAPGLVRWFTERGYTLAAPDFRLATRPGRSGGITYADQARDLAGAISWLHEQDTSEVQPVLVGYSSGAHLVALLGADERYLEGVGLSPEHLAGTVSLDVHAYDVPYALELMEGSEIDANRRLIRWLFGPDTEAQRRGSPAAHVPGGPVPPALLVSADPSSSKTSKGSIARRASERYAALLTEHGHTATATHFDDETHASLVLDFGAEGDGPTDAVAAFLASLGG